MSRRTATNNQDTSPKRVRFDSTAKEPSGEDRQQATPKSLADSLIRRHVASLQPQLATILEKLGLSHIDLLHKLHSKKLQIDRMESSDEFIPRSARIEFMFHMSKAAGERPEFIALKEETDHRISEFRSFLSAQIIKATKIEYESYSELIKDNFVKAIRVAIQGFLVGDDALCNLNSDSITSVIFENHSERLLRHATFASVTSFYEKYKQQHNLPVFPIRTPHNTTTAAPSATSRSPFFQPTNNANASTASTTNSVELITDPTNHNFHSIIRAIESIFIFPFDEYLKQCKRNQISLELKKLSTSHFTEATTAATQMELDQEPSLDRSQLQDLVRKHAKAENKVLTQEIAKLQKQLKNMQSKNSQRGRSPRGGASSQKEIKQSTRQHAQTPKPKSAQKAADVGNDTKKDSKKQKKKSGKQNTNKNGTQSRTRRNK